MFAVTQHQYHAGQVIRALSSGKNVFVEKPLCLTLEELDEIETTLLSLEAPPVLMVGFNRRFSPSAEKIKDFFSSVVDPLTVSIRFNAGRFRANIDPA